MHFENVSEQRSTKFPLVASKPPVEESDEPQEFHTAVENAAENAGCEFLFEIPGALFGTEGSRAAAIRMNPENFSKMSFIICDTKSGVIQVLDQEEAPARVSRFVKSYANVLCLLRADIPRMH